MSIGNLTALLPNIPREAVEIATTLLAIIFKLVHAGGDEAAQEEALMSAQEEAKRLLDKRKFARPT